MSTLKIILSSTRPGSIAPAIGSWITVTAGRSGTSTRWKSSISPRSTCLFLDEPQHPSGQVHEAAHVAWAHAVDTADALVIVTPEYNAGFPAPLKNALDFLHAEWCNKALGMVTYGGGLSGGARAASMLAPVTDALGLVTARHAVAIARAPRRLSVASSSPPRRTTRPHGTCWPNSPGSTGKGTTTRGTGRGLNRIRAAIRNSGRGDRFTTATRAAGTLGW